ncbi:MAG: sel1 repeat family protein [Chelatococcus sp.]|uniref:tetratricopeptide repeat protein n=1 Tax=Chelatococcus sp. TaxID=1953771 RepID=UPI0025C1517B|nr:tetratricopeptide repeat protein [Chelatococcus sp.]MBX3538334.1 sel1 repeat family protein [Chelatococcus sp.]
MTPRALILGGLVMTTIASVAVEAIAQERTQPPSRAPSNSPSLPAASSGSTGGGNAQPARPRQLPSTVMPNFDGSGSLDSPFGSPAQPGFGQPSQSAIPTLPSLPDPNADAAYGAYQRGLYRRAYDEAKQRADRNPRDAAALTLLGELTNQGLGIRRDFTKAAEWYKLADAQGDPNASFALAMMVLAGRGVPKDEMAALGYLEKAAKAGQGPAAYNLAVALISTGKPEDLKRALDLLRTASQAEIGDAQYALAVLTKQGRGLPKNDTEAAQWMARAAANDNISAQVEYAIMLFNGEGVKADEKRAAQLFALAAGRGNAIAQNRYARLLATGRGVAKNRVESAAWNLMATQQGLADRWLDDQLKDLSSAERIKAEGLARQRNADLSANLQP